jgi:hypothetical protein
MAINLDHVTQQLTVTDTAANADLTLISKGTGGLKVNNGGGQVFLVSSTVASPNNYVAAYGATASPQIRVEGASAAIDLEFLSKSTGGFRFFTQGTSYAEQFRIANTTSSVNYLQLAGSTTGNAPYFIAQGSDTNIPVAYTSKGTGAHDFYTSGFSFAPQFKITNTTSSVNFVQVTGAATGVRPTISSQGSDGNVGLNIVTKGSSGIFLGANLGSSYLATFAHSTSAVNYLQINNSATGVAPSITASGSDTNIPLVLQPKGTGALQAQQTDSTATGGNARGINAVDWQTSRDTAAKVASGQYSVIGGGLSNINNSTAGVIAGGAGNQVGGTYAGVLSGISNIANGFGSAIGAGYTNTAAGFFNFIGGGYTNSGTSGSVVTSQSGTMNGTTAVTLSASNASIKVGQLVIGTSITTFPHTYVAAVSGTSLTLSQVASGSSTSTLSFYTPHGIVVGGGNNTATGSYSFIGGGGDAGTAGNRNVASGDWSFVGGGRTNQATGLASFIGGGGVYTGSATTNFGHTASGPHSVVVGGLGNIASGESSFVGGGYGSIANGLYSTVGGGTINYANGFGSTIAGGYYGNARGIAGNTISPACLGPISAGSGISQSALLILARQTTDATATVLTSNTSAASTTNQIILPNNSAYFFTGEVVAGVTGGGNTKGWTIEGVIKRGANAAATTLVGTTVTSMYADVGAATWTIAVTADTTNGGLAVTFTGQLATTIRCVAQIRTTEMTF